MMGPAGLFSASHLPLVPGLAKLRTVLLSGPDLLDPIFDLARKHNLILHTSLTIGYDIPWRQVHAMLENAAGQTADVLKTLFVFAKDQLKTEETAVNTLANNVIFQYYLMFSFKDV